MDIHEYQAKQILKKYGIPVPPFSTISKLGELAQAIQELGTDNVVLKIQVHAGGRGKAGGVKAAQGLAEITKTAKQLLGMKIINEQTGKEGMVAQQLLISPAISIVQEYYLGCTIDRKQAQAMLIVSPAGGMSIEEVAATAPGKILSLPIPPGGCFKQFQLLRIAKMMGWKDNIAREGMQIIEGCCKAFLASDATLLEINPLAETAEGHLTALDAKISIDDNALYRQPEIQKYYDPSQRSPAEALARQYDLAYISMDGTIGCMVNGAGLAMATMDIIALYGGRPANFLDVGGGASEEKVAAGFKLILSDPHVKAVLVNIFGGIMNCETLAAGIIAAAKSLHIEVPLVIRMEGTNVKEGREMLEAAQLKIEQVATLDEAAKRVVDLGKACRF